MTCMKQEVRLQVGTYIS